MNNLRRRRRAENQHRNARAERREEPSVADYPIASDWRSTKAITDHPNANAERLARVRRQLIIQSI
jgi:hypothetical protein